MRISIAVAFVALVGVRVAHASCGSPRTALSPPTGAHLPGHATIYLFDTDMEPNVHDSLTITRDTEEATSPIRFRAIKVAIGPAYTVHRIELSASSHDRAIRVSWHGTLLARYEITNDRGVADHAAVVDVTHEKSSWMCSYTDVIQLAVDGNAIAYRIDWDDDRTTVVGPAHLMWSDTPDGDRTTLELGHPNCASYNVERGLLATPRSFELYALFADGMVQHIGTSIAQLDDDHVRLPVELIRGGDVRLPRRFGVAVTTSPHWVFASGAAGGLAGAIVVMVLGRRRRRLRVHRARFDRA